MGSPAESVKVKMVLFMEAWMCKLCVVVWGSLKNEERPLLSLNDFGFKKLVKVEVRVAPDCC